MTARLTRTQNRLIHRYSQQASDIFVSLLEFIIQNQLSPVHTQAVLDCILLAIRLESQLNRLKYIGGYYEGIPGGGILQGMETGDGTLSPPGD